MADRLAAIEAAVAITKDGSQGLKSMPGATVRKHLALLKAEWKQVPWSVALGCCNRLLLEDFKTAVSVYVNAEGKQVPDNKLLLPVQDVVERLCCWMETDLPALSLGKVAVRQLWKDFFSGALFVQDEAAAEAELDFFAPKQKGTDAAPDADEVKAAKLLAYSKECREIAMDSVRVYNAYGIGIYIHVYLNNFSFFCKRGCIVRSGHV